MMQKDDSFQKKLESDEAGAPAQQESVQLENGASLEDTLENLAEEIRGLPHPVMNAEIASKQMQMVMKASSTLSSQIRNRSGFSISFFTSKRVFGIAAAGLVLLAILGLGLGTISLITWGLPSAKVAVLQNVSGIVEYSLTGDGSDWRVASGGEKLFSESRVRTYLDSNADLVFYEGTRASLAAETSLRIMRLGGSGFDGLKAELAQEIGSIQHSVVPLRGSSSYYRVHTPAGITSVHGTRFRVMVGGQGYEMVEVDHGRVAVMGDQNEVFLTSGQATALSSSNDLLTPAYQFNLRGVLGVIQGNLWTISGVSFQVTSRTILNGTFTPGSQVEVKGRVLEDGSWTADWIDPVKTEQIKSKFTGTVTGISSTSWMVGKQVIYLSGETDVAKGIKVGDGVTVMFVVLPDGRWQAKSIERLGEEEESEKASPTPKEMKLTETKPSGKPSTPPKGAYPVGSQTPQPSPSAVQPASGNKTPTLVTECTGKGNDKQQPEGARLAERYGVPYEEIMGWFCQRYGFGEIDLAYSLARETGKPVKEIFELRKSGTGWGNIKKEMQEKITASPVPKKPVKTEKPDQGKNIKTAAPKNKP